MATALPPPPAAPAPPGGTTATALTALALALAPLTPGQPLSDPESAFLHLLIGLAALLEGARALRNGLPLPRPAVLLPLSAYAAFLVLAVFRAAAPYAGPALPGGLVPPADGDLQSALNAVDAAAMQIVLFLLVCAQARDPSRRRLFLACLVGSAAAVGAYALYQRGYAIGYFRDYMRSAPETLERVAGAEEVQQRMLSMRLNSDRATGPYGYANALGAAALLAAPLCFGLLRSARQRARVALGLCAFLCLAALVLSGSKAGLLAAKICECAGLLLLLPAGRRLRAAGPLLALVALGTAACGGAAWLALAAAGRASAELVFAAGWTAEILLLASLGERRPRWPVAAGSLVLLAGIAVAVAAGIGMDRPGPMKTLRSEAAKTFAVRADYWTAAARMAASDPLGVGLENFGPRYPQFKTPRGWPVRRAHNHYLELAAGGGWGLTAAFAACMAAVLLLRRREDPAPVPAVEEPSLRALGLCLGCSGILLLYFLYASGLFLGLSVEYFLRELRPGGSPTAAFLHGAAHFLLLPAAWACGYLAAWAAGPLEPRWIRLALAGLLLHAAADFHLSLPAIALPAWALAALACPPGPILRPAAARRPLLLLWVSLGGAAFAFGPIAAWRQSTALREAELERQFLDFEPDPARRRSLARNAAEKTHAAAELRPRDADLRREQAELVFREIGEALRRGDPTDPRLAAAGFDLWRQAILRNPWSADAAAQLARRLLLFRPDDPAARTEALAWTERATLLAPTRPRYALELARLVREEDPARAAREAARALDLEKKTTDEQAFLDGAERAEAREIAAGGR